jgi:hypothetical protein
MSRSTTRPGLHRGVVMTTVWPCRKKKKKKEEK